MENLGLVCLGSPLGHARLSFIADGAADFERMKVERVLSDGATATL